MKTRWADVLRTVAGLLAALAFLFPVHDLRAQLGFASLNGTISDPSGAGVPGVQVTLQSTTETAARTVIADSTGAYTITPIVPGTYRLVITAVGFETKTITGIGLSSGQGSTLNISLTVGKAVTNVTVNEVAPLLETTTASVGAEVNAREFVELPTLGRNFTTLIDILPGVSNIPSADAFYAPSGVSGAAVAPAIYGQRPRDTYYSIDGVPNEEPNFNRIGIFPPPEATAEMKVESGMDTGAFGWASGANVNLVTKSGTNQYHGDVWEFFRNNDLNARSYFVPNIGAFHWNQFGGSAGGPLWIPHLLSKEKAWYVFGWYEGIRIRKASNQAGLVPTDAQLGGDFTGSATLYNPFTSLLDSQGNVLSRQPFPNNMIPSGPTSLCAPQPTCINPLAVQIVQQLMPRPNLAPGVIPGANFISTAPYIERSDSWSTRVDHQFSPKDSMYARFSDWYNPNVSTFLFPATTYNRFDNIVGSETHLFSPTFLVTARYGMQRVNNANAIGGPDLLKSSGLINVFPPWNGIDWFPDMIIPGYVNPGRFFGSEGPQYYQVFTGDFKWIRGRHSLAFGGGFTRTSFGTGHTIGEEDFSSQQTAGIGASGYVGGDPLAGFLLGVPSYANRIGGSFLSEVLYHSYNWYVQDSFKFTPKLTLNVGLRWDYISPPITSPGIGTFDFVTGKYLFDHKNPITGASPNIRLGVKDPDYKGFQPRLGIAYQVTPKTVVRGSFGIFDNLYGGNQQGITGATSNWPYVFPQSLPGLNTGIPSAFLDDPFPGPPTGSPTPQACSQCENVEHSSTRNSYVEEWSLSVQRQVTPTILFETDYFGSHGAKLWGQITDNTSLNPGTDNFQNRQKWTQFAPYTNNDYAEFMSWYDGLAVKLEKRYSSGLSFLLSYTYSHAIDQEDSLGNGGNFGQPDSNPTRFNIQKFKGSAGFDIRHIFSFSYAYAIPGKTSSRLANALVSGWNWSGIVSADSGPPYVIFLTTDNENIGVSGRFTEFPNITCNPDNFTRTSQQWFNTACFSLPSFGTAGSGNRHAYYGDHLLNLDSSVFKDWPWGESRHIEFRAEFFNALNSSTFDPPSVYFGAPGFGTVSSTTRQPGRNVQFALKLHF